jgi:hypothetical protein
MAIDGEQDGAPTSNANAIAGDGDGDVFTSFDPALELEEPIIEMDPKPKKIHNHESTNGYQRLQLLKKTLEWGHISPTTPDTLPSYPFADRDPYILHTENMPDIFFAGNQVSVYKYMNLSYTSIWLMNLIELYYFIVFNSRNLLQN